MRNRATQTPSSYYGAELRFHFSGLWIRLAFLVVTAGILGILNGCSYFLYWRNRYIVTNSFQSHWPSQLAFHMVGSGLFFMFASGNVVVQLALRIMIENMSFFYKQTRIKRVYGLFVVSMLPVTTGQMLLHSNGWHNSSDPLGFIFVATVFLNILVGVLLLSYLWVASCADWVQAGVRKAAWRKRKDRLRVWETHFMRIVTNKSAKLANVTYPQQYQDPYTQNEQECTCSKYSG